MKFSTTLLIIAHAVSFTAAFNDTYLLSITYNGSGCPSGTANSVFDSKATDTTNTSTITLTMTTFTAQMGPSVPLRSSARKNCQLNLGLKYPSAWQYALKSIEYTGNADIPAGGSAQIGFLDYFSGESNQHVCLFSSPPA
jgi:hypothetical protein